MKAIGLDVLGDTSRPLPAPTRVGDGVPENAWKRAFAGLVGAGVGYFAGKRYRHQYLGALGGYSLGSNGLRLATGDGSRVAAIGRLASTGLGVAGALYLPVHPAIGFVAGAIGGNAIRKSVIGED